MQERDLDALGLDLDGLNLGPERYHGRVPEKGRQLDPAPGRPERRDRNAGPFSGERLGLGERRAVERDSTLLAEPQAHEKQDDVDPSLILEPEEFRGDTRLAVEAHGEAPGGIVEFEVVHLAIPGRAGQDGRRREARVSRVPGRHGEAGGRGRMSTAGMRLVVGITGASGVIYGIRALELLRACGVETHLVMSRSAEITLAHETDRKVTDVRDLASKWYAAQDIGAAISSGSYPTAGMILAPCSIRTMSEIASGVTSTLVTRAADVTLKERRRLVLMVRETPLHTGHLRTMTALSEMGAIIAPPVPAFYARPDTIDEMVDHTIGRALDLFGIDTGTVRRWREEPDR